MGIKFGEIDSSQILENEFRIGVLEKLVELVIAKANIAITPEDIVQARRAVVEKLKEKYPNSGIALK